MAFPDFQRRKYKSKVVQIEALKIGASIMDFRDAPQWNPADELPPQQHDELYKPPGQYWEQSPFTLAARLFQPPAIPPARQKQQLHSDLYARQEDQYFVALNERVYDRKQTSPLLPINILQRQRYQGTASGGAIALAVPNTSSGSQIIIALALGGPSVGTVVVSDAHGLTWITDLLLSDTNGSRIAVYRAKNTVSGANTITISGAAPAALHLTLLVELTGLDNLPVDRSTSTTFTTLTTVRPISVTTQFQYEYALGLFLEDTAASFSVATNPTNPYAVRLTNTNQAGGMTGSMADSVLTSARAVQPTWILSTSQSGLVGNITYKARTVNDPQVGNVVVARMQWSADRYGRELLRWEESAYRARAVWPKPVGSVPPGPGIRIIRFASQFIIPDVRREALAVVSWLGQRRILALPRVIGIPHPASKTRVLPQVPRDPTANQRQRRHMDMVSDIMNSLIGSGYLNQQDPKKWGVVTGAFVRGRAPTVLDDVSVGYSPGNLWIDQTTQTLYVCIVNGLNSATWARVVSGSGTSGNFS